MAKARNYKREYALYQGTKEQIAKRSSRNKARRLMMKAGKAHKGDGKDVDHKTPLSKGGLATSLANLRMAKASANRSFSRNKDNTLKSQTSKREKRK